MLGVAVVQSNLQIHKGLSPLLTNFVPVQKSRTTHTAGFFDN